jgi:hypothetical protein
MKSIHFAWILKANKGMHKTNYKNRFYFLSILMSVSVPAHAKLYLGADAGINSTVGFTSAITFIQEKMYVLIHLDAEYTGAGYAGLAFRIPAEIGYVPVGATVIAGGEINDSKAAFGVYTGFQRNLSRNSMVYANVTISPFEFDHRRMQYFNADIGLSIALFRILKEVMQSGYTAD